MMKPLLTIASLLVFSAALADNSGTSNQKPSAGAQTPSAPQMSEDPKMKAEGARMAALMDKLQKESDPEERRKIMSEITCPQ